MRLPITACVTRAPWSAAACRRFLILGRARKTGEKSGDKSPHSKLFAAAQLLAVLLAVSSCQDRASATAPASTSPAAPAGDDGSGISAAKAFEHMKRMVDFGPRPSGSPAIKKTQEYILSELKSYGLKITEDDFMGDTPKGKIPMKNIIAELPGASGDVVMLSGHYDTKLLPGFDGANDGASSAAAVLEMARVLAKTKPEYTIWFVFFDGEEAVVEWMGDDNTYGSRHLAAKLTAERGIKRVKAMLLVDMIGDAKLDMMKDADSTPWLVDLVWKTAQRIGNGKNFLANEAGYSDDHIAFKNAGVPVLDMIDFNYGPGNSYWHTKEDTIDKVSGESVKIVCDTVIKALPELFKLIKSGLPAETQRVPNHAGGGAH